MDKRLAIFRQEKFWFIAAIGVIMGMVLASIVLHSAGGDLYNYYQPFELGCLHCGYVPYFAQWFLWPLLIPYPFTWPLWIVVTGAGLLVAARFTKVNPFLLLVLSPVLSQLWEGQIDIIILVGLLLLVRARNPYLRGLGVAMTLVKPQLSVVPLAFIFLQEILSPEKRREFWKLSLPPLLMVALSFLVYGIYWPVDWLENAMALPVHPLRQASIDIWRCGIFLIWLPFLSKDPERRFIVSLIIGSIATPFFAIYSYTIFLAFYLPVWAVPLSFTWLVLGPWLGINANRFAWILPVALLFSLTLTQLHENRQRARNEKLNSYA